MKVLIVLVLVAIIASLGLALRFLYKDRNIAGASRTVKALTTRIALSIGLFFLLLLLYKMGLLHPHGLKADYSAPSAPQATSDHR
ncbi:MAG: DUF2909 domain-containing protein [Methylococcaceae bacterium]